MIYIKEQKNTFCGFFNFGGGISRILLIACSGGSLKNGGSPSTISMTIIPVMKFKDFTLISKPNMYTVRLIMDHENDSLYETQYLPSDHISTSGPYGNRDITSGLIQ